MPKLTPETKEDEVIGRTVTAADFEKALRARKRGGPRPLSAESERVIALQPGESVGFPCPHPDGMPSDNWPVNGQRVCPLVGRIRSSARRRGIKIETVHFGDELLVRRM